MDKMTSYEIQQTTALGALVNGVNNCTTESAENKTEVGFDKENWIQNQQKRKLPPTTESPNKRFAVRYSSEVYVKEFSKYLKKFQNTNQRNEILDKLGKKGIDEDLRPLNINGECVVNKKLVEFIITENKDFSKHVEYNWKTIEEAIIKAETIFLSKLQGNKEIDRKRRNNCVF